MNKIPNNKISFISFLWHEFMLGCDRIVDQNRSLVATRNNQSSINGSGGDFKWLSAKEPRELAKVLAVKMPENTVDSSREREEDGEERQINEWQTVFVGSRQKLISRPTSDKKIIQKTWQQAIKSLVDAIKEMRVRRQEQKWGRQSGLNNLFTYLTSATFVTAIFLTFLFPQTALNLAGTSDRFLAYLLPTAVNKEQSLNPLKFNQTQLADFIRANAYKFPTNYFNGQTTIILSEQDILGLTAGAAELTSPTTQPHLNNKWLNIIAKLSGVAKRWSGAVNKNFNNLLSR